MSPVATRGPDIVSSKVPVTLFDRDNFPTEYTLAPGLCTYDGYGNYSAMSAEMRARLLANRIERGRGLSESSGFLAAWENEGSICALLIAERFEWGEFHFNRGMAHIECFLADSGSPQQMDVVRRTIFERLIAWVSAQNIVHLACRVVADDLRAIDFLEQQQFKLMDTIYTYLFDKQEHIWPEDVRMLFGVRPFQAADRSRIMQLSRTSFEGSRFYTDPHFDQDLCEAFYGDWAEKLCDGVMSDDLFVACDQSDNVVGFLGYKRNASLHSLFGLKVMGGGLGAVDPAAPGAYPALLRLAFEQGRKRYDMAELECRANNRRVVKIWRRFGCTKVRTAHTYHLSL